MRVVFLPYKAKTIYRKVMSRNTIWWITCLGLKSPLRRDCYIESTLKHAPVSKTPCSKTAIMSFVQNIIIFGQNISILAIVNWRRKKTATFLLMIQNSIFFMKNICKLSHYLIIITNIYNALIPPTWKLKIDQKNIFFIHIFGKEF